MKLLPEISGFRQAGEKIEEGGLYVLNAMQKELSGRVDISQRAVAVKSMVIGI